MKTAWITGDLEDDEKKAIRLSFQASGVTRRRLVKILQAKIKGGFILTKDAYDTPNWEYKQADSVGYRRAMEEVISLLDE